MIVTELTGKLVIAFEPLVVSVVTAADNCDGDAVLGTNEAMILPKNQWNNNQSHSCIFNVY